MFPYQNGTWNQAYVISFTLFPIIVLLKKSKCVGTFYLRYKEDYLASEIDRKKNLRQRDQVLIRRRNSNEVASLLCFSMESLESSSKAGQDGGWKINGYG